jgi:probable HAF family extracellular repeat protein
MYARRVRPYARTTTHERPRSRVCQMRDPARAWQLLSRTVLQRAPRAGTGLARLGRFAISTFPINETNSSFEGGLMSRVDARALPGQFGALALLSLVFTQAHAQSPAWEVKDLGTLGGRFTQASDLNNVGQVTGYSEAADGQIRAFVYSRGEMSDLGSLGGGGSSGNSINDLGLVTGFALTESGEVRAFLYTAGLMSNLGTLGGGGASSGKALNALGQVAGQAEGPAGPARAVTYLLGAHEIPISGATSSTAEAINALGAIAGTYEDSSGSHAFVSQLGLVTDLVPGRSSFLIGPNVINTLGHVTGSYQSDTATIGFVYRLGKAVDIAPLGGNYSNGLAINAVGKVTGLAETALGERHAFIWHAGTTKDLGTLGGTVSVGYAINDKDQIAGESSTADGVFHAFVFANGALIDLHPMIQAAAGVPILQSAAYDINGRGQVIGRYLIADPSDPSLPVKTRAFIATPPPGLLGSLLGAVTGKPNGVR